MYLAMNMIPFYNTIIHLHHNTKIERKFSIKFNMNNHKICEKKLIFCIERHDIRI